METRTDSRFVSLARRVGEVYRQVFHVYRAWWLYILVFAIVVIAPISILNDLVSHELKHVATDKLGDLVYLLTLTGALASTSLLGQVFMAGTIGLSLFHTKDGERPPLAWVARHISYGKLMAVDLIYLAVVTIGFLLLVGPGIAAFVFFALAGPVVEIEERGVGGSFKRSVQLVRKDFWLVAWVLVTMQLGGYYVSQGIELLARELFGESGLVDDAAGIAAEVVTEPLFAIGAVLLTMRLAGLKAPRLERNPR